jgi:hypothetical protein
LEALAALPQIRLDQRLQIGRQVVGIRRPRFGCEEGAPLRGVELKSTESTVRTPKRRTGITDNAADALTVHGCGGLQRFHFADDESLHGFHLLSIEI